MAASEQWPSPPPQSYHLTPPPLQGSRRRVLRKLSDIPRQEWRGGPPSFTPPPYYDDGIESSSWGREEEADAVDEAEEAADTWMRGREADEAEMDEVPYGRHQWRPQWRPATHSDDYEDYAGAESWDTKSSPPLPPPPPLPPAAASRGVRRRPLSGIILPANERNGCFFNVALAALLFREDSALAGHLAASSSGKHLVAPRPQEDPEQATVQEAQHNPAVVEEIGKLSAALRTTGTLPSLSRLRVLLARLIDRTLASGEQMEPLDVISALGFVFPRLLARDVVLVQHGGTPRSADRSVLWQAVGTGPQRVEQVGAIIVEPDRAAVEAALASTGAGAGAGAATVEVSVGEAHRKTVTTFDEANVWRPTPDRAFRLRREFSAIHHAPHGVWFHVSRVTHGQRSLRFRVRVAERFPAASGQVCFVAVAMVVHLGGQLASGGHYVLYLREPAHADEQAARPWHFYDDLSVRVPRRITASTEELLARPARPFHSLTVAEGVTDVLYLPIRI